MVAGDVVVDADMQPLTVLAITLDGCSKVAGFSLKHDRFGAKFDKCSVGHLELLSER